MKYLSPAIIYKYDVNDILNFEVGTYYFETLNLLTVSFASKVFLNTLAHWYLINTINMEILSS